MTVTRIGATKRYSDNWEEIFARGTKKKAAVSRQPSAVSDRGRKKAAKRASSRAPAKKSSRRKK